jgi:hypothetical protein
MYRVALACLLLAGCDKFSELRGFFQARPVDDKTALEVDTTPHLNQAMGGALSIDGAKVASKTPHTQKPLAAGKHVIRVEAKGYISQEMEVDAKEGVTTQISLALKLLPGATPKQTVSTRRDDDDDDSPSGPRKKKGSTAEDNDDTEPTVHVTKTLLVTTTPTQTVFLDGASAGIGTGLRLEISRTGGDVRLGEADGSGVTFTYTNKRTGLRLKAKDLGDRSIVVDGNALGTKKGFEVDQRPRRVEITDIEGKKIVALMKVVD